MLLLCTYIQSTSWSSFTLLAIQNNQITLLLLSIFSAYLGAVSFGWMATQAQVSVVLEVAMSPSQCVNATWLSGSIHDTYVHFSCRSGLIWGFLQKALYYGVRFQYPLPFSSAGSAVGS